MLRKAYEHMHTRCSMKRHNDNFELGCDQSFHTMKIYDSIMILRCSPNKVMPCRVKYMQVLHTKIHIVNAC